jgi:hypothetical protein
MAAPPRPRRQQGRGRPAAACALPRPRRPTRATRPRIPSPQVPRSSRAMEIARDSWVRVKNGLYKDDLAKVRAGV